MSKVVTYIDTFPDIRVANDRLKQFHDVHTKQELMPIKPGVSFEPVYTYTCNEPYKTQLQLECNGLVVNQRAGVVCMPPPHLLEHNSSEAPPINWSKKVFLEEDYVGPIVIVYNYCNKWYVGTLSSAHGQGCPEFPKANVGDMAKLMLKKHLGMDVFNPFMEFNKCFCYVFRYRTKIFYPDIYVNTDLCLMRVFNKKQFKELPDWAVDDFARMYDFERPLRIRVRDLADARKLANIKKCKANPSFTIYDETGTRVRITVDAKKYDRVIAMRRALERKQKTSLLNWARILLDEGYTSAIDEFPERIGLLNLMNERLLELVMEAGKKYTKNIQTTDSQKEFALKVRAHPLSNLMFMMRRGKISCIREGIPFVKPRVLLEHTRAKYEPRLRHILQRIEEEESSNGDSTEEESNREIQAGSSE